MPKLKLSDNPNDGPNWLWSHHLWQMAWKRPGGDWIDAEGVGHGPKPFTSSVQTNVHGDVTFTVDATSLVKHWLAVKSCGAYVTSSMAVRLAGRETQTPPILIIDGTRKTCTASVGIAPNSGVLTGDAWLQDITPVLIAWDLDGVTSVANATITLTAPYVAGTFTVSLFALDLPEITSSPETIGTVRPRDPEALLLARDEMTDEASLRKAYLITDPISTGGHEWLSDPDGTKFIRCWGEDQTRFVSWRKMFQPVSGGYGNSPARPWAKPYKSGEQLGYNELWANYKIRIGGDVRAAFREGGMKLPGFEGNYDLSGSGETTIPEPTDGYWSARMWHTKPTTDYPGLYRGSVAWYTEGVLASNGGYAIPLWWDKVFALLEADKWSTITCGIKLNTVHPDRTYESDGEVWVYVNGVLVCHEQNQLIRKDPARQIQIFFVNLFHGGSAPPGGRMHYDLAQFEYWTKYPGVSASTEPVPTPTPIPTPTPVPVPTPEPTPMPTDNLEIEIRLGTRLWKGSATEVLPVPTPDPTPVPVPDPIPTPVPPPTGDLPAFVPAPGKWSEFTLNAPSDLNATLPVPAVKASLINCWCGGSYLSDFSGKGGVGYIGGLDYSPADYGGLLALNLETRLYEYRCLPTVTPWVLSNPRDEYGADLATGTPQWMHTYNAVQEFPAAWGGGPRGSLVTVAQTGGVLPGAWNHGLDATYAYDLSKDRDGIRRLAQGYDYGGGLTKIHDAVGSGMDWKRKGWWSKPRGEFGSGIAFTSASGVVTNWPTGIFANRTQIHSFDDEDLLMILGHQNGKFGVSVSIPPDMPGYEWVQVKTEGVFDPNGPWMPDVSGYMGMRWCPHPNYRCFVGMEYWTAYPGDTTLRFLLLTPPPAGQRKTAPWKWTTELVESGDGSPIRTKYSVAGADEGCVNGIFGRLVYSPHYRAFVWTRGIRHKGQLIRLPRMT